MGEPTSSLRNKSYRSRESDNSVTNDNEGHEREMRRPSIGLEEDKPERRVLVLYTGGTIGMLRNEDGGAFAF